MTRDEYKQQRDALLKTASDQLADDVTASTATMQLVDDLDAAYRAELAAHQAQLDIEAQQREPAASGIDALATKNIPCGGRVNEKMSNKIITAGPELAEIVATEEYRRAFYNRQRGIALTAEEAVALDSGTSSAGYAIPTTLLDKIVQNMTEMCPLIGMIQLLHVPGYVSVCVESVVNDAALHTENATIAPSEDTITKVDLAGYEIVRLITISAKLQNMSINALEDWIAKNMARKIALKIDNYLVNGSGSAQPRGIDNVETWTANTNAVQFASTAPTVAELEKLIGILNGNYAPSAKFLTTWSYFWNSIHPLRDDKDPTIISGDMATGYRIFGVPVVFDSQVANGDIFLGDYYEGIIANFAQDPQIDRSTESAFRTNGTDFRGTCIFDAQAIPGRIVKGAATL
jgi:HK97 family phage major capsid protein